MIKKIVTLWLIFGTFALAQNPQSQTAPDFAANAKYVNGTAPGYKLTAVGLTLTVGPGTPPYLCSISPYVGGALTLTANATNYIYLNTAASCLPAVKTSIFAATDIPIGVVVTGSSSVASVNDLRMSPISPGQSVTAPAMQNAVAALTGCATTGLVWSPATNTCIPPGGGSLSSGPQYAIPAYNSVGTGTTAGPTNITTDASGNDLNIPGTVTQQNNATAAQYYIFQAGAGSTQEAEGFQFNSVLGVDDWTTEMAANGNLVIIDNTTGITRFALTPGSAGATELYSGVSGGISCNIVLQDTAINFCYQGGDQGTGGPGEVLALWNANFPNYAWSITGTGNEAANQINDFGNLTLKQVVVPSVPGPTPGWSTSTTGGSLPGATTYFYRIVATQASDTLFSLPSSEMSLTTGAGSTNSNTVTFSPSMGATGFDLYRSTTSGAEQKCNAAVQNVGQLTSGFVDTGFTCTGATVPTSNTTGGVLILPQLVNQPCLGTGASGQVGPGTCSGLTLETNGSNNSSQTVLNLVNSSANATGLTLTESNPSAGTVQGEIGGTANIGHGGTGQTTANAAFNALSPMSAVGDTIYGGTSGAATRLAGNTTATKDFLCQTGTGSASAPPLWCVLASGDVPNNAANTTGNAATATVAGGISTNGTANQVWGMNSGGTAQGWQNAGSGTTTNALTAAATGGAAPGSTFNGSAPVNFDYHSFGAAPLASPTFSGTVTVPNGAALGTPVSLVLTNGTALPLSGVTAAASGTGTYDFSGATQLKHPVAAGYTSAANGELGYDSTNLNWHIWANGTDEFLAGFSIASPPTSGHLATFAKTTNSWELTDGGAVPTGTVTSVGFTGGLISVGTPTTTPAFTVAGTSGGIPYFSSASAWASSGALTQHGLLVGGGAGAAPAALAVGGANFPLIGQASANPAFSTIAYPTSLISGGILYGSSTAALASSALLAQYLPVVGGGAGAGPATISSAGTTGQPLLSGGASANPAYGTVGVGGGGTGTASAPTAAGQLMIAQSISAYGPEALSQDCTITASGVITCTKTNNVAFSGYATATYVANTTITVGSSVAFSANTCSSATGTANTASTASMTGLATSMTLQFTPTSDVKGVTGWSPGSGGQLYFQSWPSAAGTASYYVCNPTAATITTSGSVTWNVSAR